jgi:ribosomal-protein-serine acetyltransferase
MTDAITIRPYRADDAPLILEAVAESFREIEPFMPWASSRYSLADAESWVTSRHHAFADGTEFDFVVVTSAGRFLGACGLNQIDPVNRRANLGYWVRSSATSRGVASEAVRMLVRWAFQNTDLIRLEIVVSNENAASLRVAEKSGAHREGILRNRLLLHGRPHEAVMFSLVR